MSSYAEMARERRQAHTLYLELRALGLDVHIEEDLNEPGYRVVVGSLRSLSPLHADRIMRRVRSNEVGLARILLSGPWPPDPEDYPPGGEPQVTTETLAVSVARSRGGGVLVSLRYSYEGRPAGHRRRVEVAKALLQETLERLEDGEVADIGFAEDSVAGLGFALIYGLRPFFYKMQRPGDRKLKVATHLVFAECCWFAFSAVGDVHYETPSVLLAAACAVLPDADYPKSWLGYQLGSVSEDLNRLFGRRSFLHSFVALVLVTVALGLPLWRLFERPAPMLAVFVGYGSHFLADMMTLGGVQLFWPSRLIAVFPGRDEYRVVSGGNSERVFVALALVFALLFYPVSRVGFDGLIHRMGGDDTLYGRVTDGDTIEVDAQGRITPVRRIGVDTPETVAPDEPVGCFGPEASDYTKQVLHERQTGAEGEVVREGRLVRLRIPRIGDSEDAYGRTLAYVYLDASGDGSYEHSFNEDLVILGLARTTDFSHERRRGFERLREEAEERGAGLWGVCAEAGG